MKDHNGIKIIGIDHGYGNMKTANTCFPTGLIAYDQEPTFRQNLLIYDGRYYTVGTGHKEFHGDKIMDEDYYVLTLAAMARRIRSRVRPFSSQAIRSVSASRRSTRWFRFSSRGRSSSPITSDTGRNSRSMAIFQV